ncbi:MAG TPA: acyl-CoA thioesterase [Acidimicrobiales bacterium]|jgi:acyl-CoA thioesterase-2|nr:acyl-CoA thioesterase [Acidimicrobiales bacterium]
MDARQFIGLEPSHNPHRWVLPVTPSVCTGGGFLFGGCGLAAAIAALEGTTGRPTVWAASQYLSYARPPDMMDVDVTIAAEGRQVTQARAVAHVVDREILTVNAALGSREIDASGQWEEMPKVPPPDDCAPRGYRHPRENSIMQRLDMRLADGRDFRDFDGTSGSGRSALWARLPEVLDMSAGTLAVLGDYVPFGVGQALGQMAGGTSIDNTLRVARLVPTEWVLLDIQVHTIQSGFGHGLVHLWSEDGTLLAIASQSCIVRFWSPEVEASIRAEMGGENDQLSDELANEGGR